MDKPDLILYLKSNNWIKQNSIWFKKEFRCKFFTKTFQFQGCLSVEYRTYKAGKYTASYFSIYNTGAGNIFYPYLHCSY